MSARKNFKPNSPKMANNIRKEARKLPMEGEDLEKNLKPGKLRKTLSSVINHKSKELDIKIPKLETFLGDIDPNERCRRLSKKCTLELSDKNKKIFFAQVGIGKTKEEAMYAAYVKLLFVFLRRLVKPSIFRNKQSPLNMFLFLNALPNKKYHSQNNKKNFDNLFELKNIENRE